jgi:hypothetical protein
MAQPTDNDTSDTSRSASSGKRTLLKTLVWANIITTVPHLTRDTPEELQGGMSWQKNTVDCVPNGKKPTPNQIADALSEGKTSLPVCPPSYQETRSVGVRNGKCVPEEEELFAADQGKCKKGEVEEVDWKDEYRPNYTVCKITRDGKSGPCPDTPDYKPTEFHPLLVDRAARR